jgi:DNA processing protein
MKSPCRTDDPILFWFTLALTPGVGRALLRSIAEDPDAPRDLSALAGRLVPRDPDLARALIAPPESVRQAIDASLAWSNGQNCHLLSIDHPDYPVLLRQIPDPPPVLHVRGQLAALNAPALAIVGSRQATLDGVRTARSMAAELARRGIAIASGLAAGIDHAAHAGALDAAGTSLAVIGTGVDECYPAAHRGIADRIAEQGAVISELPLGSGPLAHHFPRRNRIIAGLAAGVLVVQAARRSGSLITARLGLEYGREVMAVPGPVQSTLYKGCHQLLREGAGLVESSEDVLAAIASTWRAPPSGPARATPVPGAPDEATRPASSAPDEARSTTPAGQLLEPWGWCPFDPDSFAAHAGLTPGQSAQCLLELELDGMIERLPDGRLQRIDG